jgi:L-fuculose-phosphate aldolase
MYEQFRDIGRDCFLSGLVSSHAGNISVRRGDRLLITRRGAMLGALRAQDLVETGIDRDDQGFALASSELLTHRAIYRETGAQAVLHTHPPHGIVLSLDRDEFVPVDFEGSCLFDRVPVVTAKGGVGSAETAASLSAAMVHHRLCLLRGHGLFAAADRLELAYQWTSSFEASARVAYLARLAGVEPRP